MPRHTFSQITNCWESSKSLKDSSLVNIASSREDIVCQYWSSSNKTTLSLLAPYAQNFKLIFRVIYKYEHTGRYHLRNLLIRETGTVSGENRENEVALCKDKSVLS